MTHEKKVQEMLPPSPELAEKTADAVVAFHAQLVRKGISEEAALDLAGRIGGSASSWGDGHCGDLARRLLDVMPEKK